MLVAYECFFGQRLVEAAWTNPSPLSIKSAILQIQTKDMPRAFMPFTYVSTYFNCKFLVQAACVHHTWRRWQAGLKLKLKLPVFFGLIR